MEKKAEKLLSLAKRHAEISQEIKECLSQRETNLLNCHKSPDDDFQNDKIGNESCLCVAYRWVKEDRESVDGYNDGYAHPTEFSGFEEVILNYGCANCQGAYKLKRRIGELKRNRGRIHSAITKIGQSL